MVWEFEEVEPTAWETLKPGAYRVRIKDAIDKVSQAGRDMIELTLTVSESGHQLRYYIVFNDDTPDTQRMTNQRLTAFFRSFGIEPGNFNYPQWVGKIGVVHVVIEQWEGQDRNSVKYCIEPAQQGNVKGWIEPGSGYSAPTPKPKVQDAYAYPPY